MKRITEVAAHAAGFCALALVAGCNALEVLPGLCEGREVRVDSLKGEWIFDAGFAPARSVVITRGFGSAKYHVESIGDSGIDTDFTLCRLDKRTLVMEIEGNDDPAYVDVLRVTRVDLDDAVWLLERVDTSRADVSGLSYTETDPPGLIQNLVSVNTTGDALDEFLEDAPYQFTTFLRR